nr:serine hydroxymethyltransferase [bacterium]
YYGGCDVVDQAERLSIERACSLFECRFANVQPHSGTQANQAVYSALINPGDRILSMALPHGGHLSHGHPVSLVGQLYEISNYQVERESGILDMDRVARIAHEESPDLIVCGYSNYSRIVDFEAFGRIAKDVGAFLLADIAHIAGLVATGRHPSPFPHCDVATSTTHKTLRGPRGGLILSDNEDVARRIDKALFPGLQGGPLMHVIAGKGVAFHLAMKPEFSSYIDQVILNAQRLAYHLEREGLDIVSGGTDNHLFSCDLRPWGLTGKVAEAQLGDVGITVNKNTIPYDPESPFVTSGIRLGTAAVTSRGMGEKEMEQIARFISDALQGSGENTLKEVKSLCQSFPLYTTLS